MFEQSIADYLKIEQGRSDDGARLVILRASPYMTGVRGSKVSVAMTVDEARRLARELLDAADGAEFRQENKP